MGTNNSHLRKVVRRVNDKAYIQHLTHLAHDVQPMLLLLYLKVRSAFIQLTETAKYYAKY